MHRSILNFISLMPKSAAATLLPCNCTWKTLCWQVISCEMIRAESCWCRQLPYLEAVVLETLRLRPPAYIVGRCAAEADDLAGYHVQPGKQSAVALHSFLCHQVSTDYCICSGFMLAADISLSPGTQLIPDAFLPSQHQWIETPQSLIILPLHCLLHQSKP